MAGEARYQHEAGDAAITGGDLDRDRPGERLAEHDVGLSRRPAGGQVGQPVVVERQVGRVGCDFDIAPPREPLDERPEQLTGAVHAGQHQHRR